MIAKRASLRAAINAKCRDCVYDPKAGGSAGAQIALCSCVGCPLWPVRPAPSAWPDRLVPRDPATVSREWVRRPLREARQEAMTAISGEDRQGVAMPVPAYPNTPLVAEDDAIVRPKTRSPDTRARAGLKRTSSRDQSTTVPEPLAG